MALTQFSKEYIKNMLYNRKYAIERALSRESKHPMKKFSVQNRTKRTADEWRQERQRVIDCINQLSDGPYG